MKLATTTGDFFRYGYNDEESISAVVEAGFKYIDYSFSYDFHNRKGLLGDNWQEFANKLLDMSQKLSFKFVQAHAPLGRPLEFNEKHDQFIADTKRSIEAAAYLGIPNIVVHSGYLDFLTREETFEQNVVFYNDILNFAEQFDINILTENFDKMCNKNCYWFDNAADVKELVERVNHPRFKVCWDAGHGNLQDMPQHEALRLLGESVYGLHIQDNVGVTDDHMIPFFGSLNFDSIMHGLKDINYQGYFTFESDGTPLATYRRKKFPEDERCMDFPVDIRKKLEVVLYDIGKFILTKYDCFEE